MRIVNCELCHHSKGLGFSQSSWISIKRFIWFYFIKIFLKIYQILWNCACSLYSPNLSLVSFVSSVRSTKLWENLTDNLEKNHCYIFSPFLFSNTSWNSFYFYFFKQKGKSEKITIREIIKIEDYLIFI